MIELQYYTFKWQNISSAMIFISALIIMGVLINGYPSWAYSPDIILKNEDFNIILITTIIMGLLSLTFAVNPNWMTWVNKTCKACGDVISMLEVLDEEEAIKDNYESKAVYSKKHENGAEKIIGKEYIEPKTAPCHNREDSGHEMDEVDDPGPVISQSGKTIQNNIEILIQILSTIPTILKHFRKEELIKRGDRANISASAVFLREIRRKHLQLEQLHLWPLNERIQAVVL